MKTGLISIVYVFIFSSIYGQSLISENFSTGIPAGWSVSGAIPTSSWQFNDSLDENSGGCLVANIDQNTVSDSTMIELPSVNIGNLSDPYLTFSAAIVRANFISPELSLMYNDSGTWREVEAWGAFFPTSGVPTRETFSWQPLTRDNIEWVHIQYSLKPFRKNQNIQLAFRGDFMNGGFLLLDSVHINNNSSPVATLPFIEGFETPSFLPLGWERKGTDYLSDWVRNDSAGAFGVSNSCANFNGFRGAQSGSVYELQSAWFQLDGNTSPQLSFDYAYTKMPNLLSDRLSIWYKVNNRQWELLEEMSIKDLQTAPDQITEFRPTSREWRQKTLAVPVQGFQGKAKVAFRYHVENGFLLYLDNVTLSETLSINQLNEKQGLRIYPNPANKVLNIKTQTGETITSYSVYDIAGRVVLLSDEPVKNTIDISRLQAGTYIINVEGNGIQVKDTFTVVR